MLEILFGATDDFDGFSWSIGQKYGELQFNPYDAIEVTASGDELEFVLLTFPHLRGQLACNYKRVAVNNSNFEKNPYFLARLPYQCFYGETAMRIAGVVLDECNQPGGKK